MHISWINDFARSFVKTESSAALLTWEGDILHAKSDLSFELTGFKSVVDSSLKYIPLKPGEILLANDPYSGGSFLYRYSFLMPLTLPDTTHTGLVLCVRRAFSPRLSVAQKLDDEGLRIPPTPIFQKGQLVTPILEAMSMHPSSPAGFTEWLKETVSDVSELFQKWLMVEKNFKHLFTPQEVKRYVQFSHRFTSDKLLEKAQGEARTEVRFDSGEIMKLHLEIHDGRIKADFGGSSPGVKVFLPDYATFGSCYSAICDFYELTLFKNSGTFSVLQVTKPSGCFLNGKFPASTFRGFQIATAAVYQAMTSALHQIVKSSQTLWNEDRVKMELAFSNESRWLSEWDAKKMCESISVEALEAAFPVQFKRIEKATEDGGVRIEFQTKAPCQWQWLSDFTLHPLKAPKGFKTPPVHTLEVRHEGSEWKNLASTGGQDLLPGSHVRLTLWGAFEPIKKAPVAGASAKS